MGSDVRVALGALERYPFDLETRVPVTLHAEFHRATMGACLQFWRTGSRPVSRMADGDEDGVEAGVVDGVEAGVPPWRTVTLASPDLEVVTNHAGAGFVYCRPCRLHLFSCEDYTEELGRDHVRCRRHRRNVQRAAGAVAG